MACNVIYEPSLSPFKYCSVCGFLTPKTSLCCFSFEKHAFGSFLHFSSQRCHKSSENRPWGQNYVVCCLLVFYSFLFSLTRLFFLSLSLFFDVSFFSNTIFIDKSWVESKVGDIKRSNEKKTSAAFHVYAFASLPLGRVGMLFLFLLQHAHNFKSFSRIQLIYLLFY